MAKLLILICLHLVHIFPGIYFCYDKYMELEDKGTDSSIEWKFTSNLDGFTNSKKFWLASGKKVVWAICIPLRITTLPSGQLRFSGIFHSICKNHVNPGFDMVVMVVKIESRSFSTAGQFTIVYTCKPHINHKYSLVLITPRIFSSKMVYFG